MQVSVKEQLPEDFNDGSRVWIYQSSRLFFISEALDIEDKLAQFTAEWKSHGVPVKGYANLFFGQFIVIMADETATGVSGCSTDSSVQLIKEIEQQMKVQLFERQTLAFLVDQKIQLLPMSQLDYAAKNDFINPDTLYFDNTVLTKKQLEERWIIPIKDSWLGKRVKFPELS